LVAQPLAPVALRATQYHAEALEENVAEKDATSVNIANIFFILPSMTG